MNSINLLPESYFAAKRSRRRGWTVAVVGVLALLGGGSGWILGQRQLDALATQIAAVEGQLRVEESRQAVSTRLDSEERALRKILGIRRLVQTPLPLSSALTLAYNLVPPSIVLSRASLQAEPPVLSAHPAAAGKAEAKSGPAKPLRMELEGLALSDLEVARFVSAISSQRLFNNVKLSSSRNVNIAGQARVQFSMHFEVPLDRDFIPAKRRGKGL